MYLCSTMFAKSGRCDCNGLSQNGRTCRVADCGDKTSLWTHIAHSNVITRLTSGICFIFLCVSTWRTPLLVAKHQKTPRMFTRQDSSEQVGGCNYHMWRFGRRFLDNDHEVLSIVFQVTNNCLPQQRYRKKC